LKAYERGGNWEAAIHLLKDDDLKPTVITYGTVAWDEQKIDLGTGDVIFLKHNKVFQVGSCCAKTSVGEFVNAAEQ